MKSVPVDNKCTTLNLAMDAEYAYLMRNLGGEEKVQTRFPEVYNRILNIREKNQKGELLDDKTILEIPEPAQDLVDAVYLPAIYYKDKTLTVYYAVSYYEIPKAMYLTIQVINDAGLIVAHKNLDPEKPVHALSGKYVFSNIDLDEGYTVEFQSYVTLKGKDLSVTKVRSNISSEEIFAQRARVEAPRKRTDEPDEVPDDRCIRAFYDRFPFRLSETDVDYVYEDAYDRANQRVSVNLEAAGNIALSKDITAGSFEEGEDIAIMDFGCGAVKYTSEGASMGIRDKTFTWLFKPEWNASIPCKYYFAETVVHLSYILGFYPRDEINKHVLYLTSFLEEDMGNSCRKIRKLKIQIGCVAEGTKVLMRDGTQKAIQEIRIGEQIMGAAGEEPGIVKNVWHGKERKMYCITTEDGSSLLLTGSHYVLTDAGMVMAAHMHLGMRIRMGNGELQKIRELYTVDEETTVYNLSVQKADGHSGCMICENMVLADNDYSEPPKQEPARSALEADEFLLELDALMKER